METDVKNSTNNNKERLNGERLNGEQLNGKARTPAGLQFKATSGYGLHLQESPKDDFDLMGDDFASFFPDEGSPHSVSDHAATQNDRGESHGPSHPDSFTPSHQASPMGASVLDGPRLPNTDESASYSEPTFHERPSARVPVVNDSTSTKKHETTQNAPQKTGAFAFPTSPESVEISPLETQADGTTELASFWEEETNPAFAGSGHRSVPRNEAANAEEPSLKPLQGAKAKTAQQRQPSPTASDMSAPSDSSFGAHTEGQADEGQTDEVLSRPFQPDATQRSTESRFPFPNPQSKTDANGLAHDASKEPFHVKPAQPSSGEEPIRIFTVGKQHDEKNPHQTLETPQSSSRFEATRDVQSAHPATRAAPHDLRQVRSYSAATNPSDVRFGMSQTHSADAKPSSQTSDKLVVAISSRALFDLDESNEIYEAQGVEAYRAHQIEKEDEVLAPGIAFALVKKLLRFNEWVGKPCVEVVLISRNSADTGLRVFNSIEHHGLDITRAVFTSGASPYRYIGAVNAHLFLSANVEDTRKASQAGLAAAMIPTDGSVAGSTSPGASDHQLRIAFDADAVIFNGDSEVRFQEQGLEAFNQHETHHADQPLEKGPLYGFLKAVQNLQLSDSEQKRLRIALVTARGAPSHKRVIHTLRGWNVHIDEVFFMGGSDKATILREFGADFFFDDKAENISNAINNQIPSGKVIG